MITLTDAARDRIRDLIIEENNPNVKLRIYIQGGGCAGMQYGFTFDEDVQEDDFDIEFNGVHVLIDSASNQYLDGATVDFVEDLMSSAFKVSNPNATTSCGCGSSFAI